EWWANLVTASDWRDFWIHEGFQSFMDTLYLEEIAGKERYLAAMRGRAQATINLQPVAPREPKFSYEVYLLAPDYVRSNNDIYGKGAVVLHTLRYLIGDDAFFRALRRMSYPTKEMETFTDGRQARFVNTDDFLTIAERESMRELDWFFEVYLRQPKLPRLLVNRETPGMLSLKWETPDGLPFPMPVDVVANGKPMRVEMKDGKGSVKFSGTEPVIDPDGWILKAR
ncbi:MAG: M1 family peptidase, partial [Blastocatellia bacterium]|nr:M1 family peptidase [Blastocatellia bacterium]